MKTILLVHDIFSNADNLFIQSIAAGRDDCQVIVPELSIHPEEAMQSLRDICQSESPVLVIGWRSGGFYAQQLTNYNRIIISPEYHPSTTFNKILNGYKSVRIPYVYPHSNGEKTFKITPALVKEYVHTEVHQFDNVSQSDKLLFCYFWFNNNEENLQLHQKYYHDVNFLPGKDLLSNRSIQTICNHINYFLEDGLDSAW